MTGRSLRLRLVLAQAATIAVALVLAWIGLAVLFERHLERRVDDELATYVRQLAGQLAIAPDGAVTLDAGLVDPRFEVPLSGLYWQVESVPPGTLLRSRSLWDDALDLPSDPLWPGSIHRHDLAGPGGAMLMVHERPLILASAEGDQTVRVAAAIDRASLAVARAAFATQLAWALALLALVLIAAALAQVWFGLRPFEQLRRAVGLVRTRQTARLEGHHPAEVQPLVDEVNALLEAQSVTIARARAQAADLAHGLKTPLTILHAEAAALRGKGDAEAAATIEGLARDMQRQIDRDLARARLAASRSAQAATPLAPIARQLVQTLERTPRGSRLSWTVETDEALAVAVDADDLAELLGNLLENAAKWAVDVVELAAVPTADSVRITVADDGTGVPADARDRLGTRGVRLDATTPGHGIGLGIVSDIASAYGGKLAFADAALGGLEVAVTLPRAQASIGQASSR
jgi:signal transduction histidine kinase